MVNPRWAHFLYFPFQFCHLVVKGEDGPCGATLLLNLLMPFCCVSLLCVLLCTT